MMKVCSFYHGSHAEKSTVSEIKRVHDWAESEEFLGTYAYATQSGVAAFDMELGVDFWGNTSSRWIFGIDYGRTQPSALRYIANKTNAEVRVYDGSWLVNQSSFVPRRDFHSKASFASNVSSERFGMVVGSGNFSASGLRKNVEAGATLQASGKQERRKTMRRAFKYAEKVWNSSTPLEEIIDEYEEKWEALFALDSGAKGEDDVDLKDFSGTFWIEAGYVTKNRGEDRPGNQIDLPRGMSEYFGFNPPKDIQKNSVIGDITFISPTGDRVTRNLRLGNNLMEKITLPIPETHGFDLYDGKVLVFWPGDTGFEMRALESDDFERAFRDRLAGVQSMGSGRRYGHIT